jgi:ELWxxDGT repeat protein
MAMAGVVFFGGSDGVHGHELWKSDGTAAGTVMVKDIKPGADSSFAEPLGVLGGMLLFQAADLEHGIELWKTDGTEAGTTLVKDIWPGSPAFGWSEPGEAIVANGVLYFAATDELHGREVWRSDGTAAGTYMLADVFPGGGSSNPRRLTFAGDRIYFEADDGVQPRSLWYVRLDSPVPTRLANISTRARVQTGNDVTIGGFIIGGSTPKTVVVRARGPSLAQFGVQGVLADPFLQLYSGSTPLAANDDWGAAANAAQLQASGFAPANPKEAAILTTLAPGPYTAIVSGAGSTIGVGIVEIFEVDALDVPLINISTRGRVETGENVMIGGFIIQGEGPQTVVVRARGPSLTATGVTSALPNPMLQLYTGQTQIGVNDNWQSAANATAIQASGFAPADPAESAILITLDPGAYSAIVSGVGGTSGTAIIEVFRK